MSPSVKNYLFDTIALGAGFVAAIGVSVVAPRYFPVLAHNEHLLNGWRAIVAFFAIILVKRLLLFMPRVRVFS